VFLYKINRDRHKGGDENSKRLWRFKGGDTVDPIGSALILPRLRGLGGRGGGAGEGPRGATKSGDDQRIPPTLRKPNQTQT